MYNSARAGLLPDSWADAQQQVLLVMASRWVV
jgi:hypothetical protein